MANRPEEESWDPAFAKFPPRRRSRSPNNGHSSKRQGYPHDRPAKPHHYPEDEPLNALHDEGYDDGGLDNDRPYVPPEDRNPRLLRKEYSITDFEIIQRREVFLDGLNPLAEHLVRDAHVSLQRLRKPIVAYLRDDWLVPAAEIATLGNSLAESAEDSDFHVDWDPAVSAAWLTRQKELA